MKNILVIYPFPNQNYLMHNFASRLKEYGILVDTICIGNFDFAGDFSFEKNSKIVWPVFIEQFFKLSQRFKNKTLRKIAYRLSFQFLIQRLFRRYNLVDFHAYYPYYNNLISNCIKKDVRFDITLWGSELLRADEKRIEQLRYGFDNCYLVKMSDNLQTAMLRIYGKQYYDKCRTVFFGNCDFPKIDAIEKESKYVLKERLYGKVDGKKILVLGYNGIPSQNHDKMIHALDSLSQEEKASIHVVLPMTYGATQDYIAQIRRLVNDTNISYTLLDSYMSTDEVAALRITADIVINIQNTDALAGSLQDHLYCGNVCIFGDWLDYSLYSQNEIFYIKTSMNEVSSHLRDVLLNFNKYYQASSGNHDKIKNLLSWETTIVKQVSVYGE